MSGWDDVGDFSSLADLLPAESNQPRVLGDHSLGMFNILKLPHMNVVLMGVPFCQF